jgi:hypothetical protein
MYTKPTRPAKAGKYSLVPDRLDQPRARKPVQCTPWVPICISFKKPVPPIRIKLWVSPHQIKSKKDTGHAFVGFAGSCRPIIGLKLAQSKMSQLSCSIAVKTWSECGLRLFFYFVKNKRLSDSGPWLLKLFWKPSVFLKIVPNINVHRR